MPLPAANVNTFGSRAGLGLVGIQRALLIVSLRFRLAWSISLVSVAALEAFVEFWIGVGGFWGRFRAVVFTLFTLKTGRGRLHRQKEALYVIRSFRDLEHLPRDRRVNGLLSRERVAFDIPNVGRTEQALWEKTLNRYQDRCGCATGGIFALVTVVVGGMLIAETAGDASDVAILKSAVALVISAVIAGVVGKFVGLVVTQIQFKIACGKLRTELLPNR